MKFFVKLSIVVCTTILFFSCMYVKADSGWDVDYDSGSSWSSSDDSWSSSDDSWSSSDDSWSSSSSSSSHSSSSSGDVSPVEGFFIIYFFIVLCVSAIIFIKKKDTLFPKVNYQPHSYNNYNVLTQEDIDKVDSRVNIENLKNKVFEIYKIIQNAWTEFDFDTLRKYATDELFNAYESQLNVLKMKNEKNIMNSIELKNVDIIKFAINNNIEEVQAKLCITMYDYVVDANENVIRGDSNQKLEVTYIITLIKSVDKVADKCPKCGADITEITSGQCSFCRAFITNDSDEFRMSKKENINQRRL